MDLRNNTVTDSGVTNKTISKMQHRMICEWMLGGLEVQLEQWVYHYSTVHKYID